MVCIWIFFFLFARRVAGREKSGRNGVSEGEMAHGKMCADRAGAGSKQLTRTGEGWLWLYEIDIVRSPSFAGTFNFIIVLYVARIISDLSWVVRNGCEKFRVGFFFFYYYMFVGWRSGGVSLIYNYYSSHATFVYKFASFFFSLYFICGESDFEGCRNATSEDDIERQTFRLGWRIRTGCHV